MVDQNVNVKHRPFALLMQGFCCLDLGIIHFPITCPVSQNIKSVAEYISTLQPGGLCDLPSLELH